MRDVSLEEFSDEIRDLLADQGINVPRGTVRILVKQFFENIENILLNEPETRFSMYNRDLTHIFWMIDKKKLCEEFASGQGVSYDVLVQKNKLSKPARRFLRKRMSTTMHEKALQ